MVRSRGVKRLKRACIEGGDKSDHLTSASFPFLGVQQDTFENWGKQEEEWQDSENVFSLGHLKL